MGGGGGGGGGRGRRERGGGGRGGEEGEGGGGGGGGMGIKLSGRTWLYLSWVGVGNWPLFICSKIITNKLYNPISGWVMGG